jgi:hypothetical protein
MKWFPVLSICALALFSNACERHPASELPKEFSEGAHEEKKAPEGRQETGKPAPAKPDAEAKPGEAPKFFPENK